MAEYESLGDLLNAPPPPPPPPPSSTPPPAGKAPPPPAKAKTPGDKQQSSTGSGEKEASKSCEKTEEPPANQSAEAIDIAAMSQTGTMAGGTMAGSRPRDESRDKFFKQLICKVTKKKHGKRGHFYNFGYKEVVRVLISVKKIFQAEKPMIEMKIPCIVVGDVHGQYADLIRIFELFDKDGVTGYLNNRFVFLGDYVDRGKQSLEIVMLLFSLKVLYPDCFALLRGNHECRAINKAYGFYAEIKERFLDPKKAIELFEMFNEVFTHLPLACLVADNILCMHGGISSKMKSKADILKVAKPLKDVAKDPIATDLLWADPMCGLPGEIPNKVRGVSIYFGENVLDTVMDNLKIKLVIRGHQMMMNGFNLFHNRLVTVFSAAAYYPDKPNRGAVCVVDKEGRIGFKCFIPHPKEHPDYKPKVFRGDHDNANEHDTGYVKVAPGKKAPEGSGEPK